jgi:hypothetical protein
MTAAAVAATAATVAAARARDATCLELLVSFFFLYFLSFFYYTNFILGLLSTSERLWQQYHHQRLKMWITGAAGEEGQKQARWKAAAAMATRVGH